MTPQLDAFFLSFAVIFVAELGDKSQLMALTFATRYRAIDVLIGISIATLLVHLGSVALGATIAAVLPTRRSRSPAAWRSSCSLPGRCAATRSARRRPAERHARPVRSIFAVGTAFFLAELGDKTMLATITLATREEAIGTWLGSTAGMIAADAIAIGVGRWLGTRLPERTIRYVAAALFVLFGVLLIAEGLGWFTIGL